MNCKIFIFYFYYFFLILFIFSYEERYRILNSIIRTHKKETTYEEFLAKSFTPLATKTLGKEYKILRKVFFLQNEYFSSSLYFCGFKGGRRKEQNIDI